MRTRLLIFHMKAYLSFVPTYLAITYVAFACDLPRWAVWLLCLAMVANSAIAGWLITGCRPPSNATMPSPRRRVFKRLPW